VIASAAGAGQEWRPEHHLVTASAPEQLEQFLVTPPLMLYCVLSTTA